MNLFAEHIEPPFDPFTFSHPAIGRYMQSFEGKYFLMTSAYSKQYPDDAAFTVKRAARPWYGRRIDADPDEDSD